MPVSGIGSWRSTSPIYATSTASTTSAPDSASDSQDQKRANKSQFRGDFASLLSAVQTGDMTSAQQALTAVKNDISSMSNTYSAQSTPSSGQVPPTCSRSSRQSSRAMRLAPSRRSRNCSPTPIRMRREHRDHSKRTVIAITMAITRQTSARPGE